VGEGWLNHGNQVRIKLVKHTRRNKNILMEVVTMKQRLACLAVAVLFCTGLLIASDAHAQFGKGGGGKGAGRGQGFNCPLGVNLTQEQTAKLESLQSAYFKDTATVRSDMYKKELELQSLMLDPNADAGKAKKVQADISALESQVEQKYIQYQIDARKILTPEQIAQLPPGCGMGLGNMSGGKGCGMRGGQGPGAGCRMGNW
jgi:zinc resistance-associated protein